MNPLPLLFSLACVLSIAAAEPARPNIVIIYADDLGWGDVGCYGATALATPQIDRLAAEGTRFTSGYASAATCTPSRYAMLTGEHAWRQAGRGVAPADAKLLIDPETTTLADILKDAGYRTGVIGKWHLGLGDGNVDWNGRIAPGPLEVGFDRAFLIPATVDRVPCVFVEDHHVVGLDPADPLRVNYRRNFEGEPTGRERPDLLKILPSHGHDMSIVNGISRIGYMAGGEAAHWRDEDIADVLVAKAVEFLEAGEGEPFLLYFALHDPHVPRVPHERFAGATDLGPRGDVIVQIDWCVGQILGTLDGLGLADDTLVVFSSDNGPVLDDGYQDESAERVGDHRPAGPFRGWKYSRYEGGTRVPFIVRWPGRVAAGAVSDAIVGQIDFPATFAALVGRELAEDEAPDSFNILPALLDPSAEGRPWLVQEGIRGNLGLRVGEWKFHDATGPRFVAWQTGIDIGARPEAQLYHLAEDPGEERDLAAERPEKVAEMERLLRWIRETPRTRP